MNKIHLNKCFSNDKIERISYHGCTQRMRTRNLAISVNCSFLVSFCVNVLFCKFIFCLFISFYGTVFLMLDTMSVRWIFCFTFLLLIHKVSVQRVEGVIGQTVMLPCSITQKSVNVFWRYRDSRPVCDIIDGKADYEDQDLAYRGRVSLFSSEIDKGNFSIMLSNVVESDAGTYTCTSPGLHRVKIELTVTERPVTTKRPETQTTTQKKSRRSGNGDVTRQADGLLTILLACALLCSLLF